MKEGRHCASCDRAVYDLRRYSEARVLALTTLLAPTGFCARQTLDENGELVLASGDVHRARAPRWAGSTMALLSVAGCATTTGTTAAPQPVAAAPAAAAPAAAAPADAECAPELVMAAAPAAAQPGGLPNAARASTPSAAASAPQPAADRDGDGIPEVYDQCPNTPGVPPAGCSGTLVKDGEPIEHAPDQRGALFIGAGHLQDLDERQVVAGWFHGASAGVSGNHNLRVLLEAARTLCADQPQARARIELLLKQILLDEIGHVLFLRSQLGPIRLALSRILLPIIARVLLAGYPEVQRLFGWRRMLDAILNPELLQQTLDEVGWPPLLTGCTAEGDAMMQEYLPQARADLAR